MTPRSRFLVANRLRHHLLEWGEHGPVVLLLHGFLEHAHAWDLVAPRLAAAGHHVFALDWRGHGDSEWVGSGGYYHFADYAADLAFLVRALGGRAVLVGHSMGATAAMSYAGLEPERVPALVLVDGLGPPDLESEPAPHRYEAWIRDLARRGERRHRTLTLEQATARLHERCLSLLARRGPPHGRARDPGLERRAPVEVRSAPQDHVTGAVLARAGGNLLAPGDLARALSRGRWSPLRLDPADRDERLAILRARRTTIAGSGHHPHLQQPETFAEVVLEFLASAGS